MKPNKRMKNIQVIDGADNCTYDIYSLKEDDFAMVFPNGTDIEFIGDFIERVGDKNAEIIMNRLWKNFVNKKEVIGIHGTLFFELDSKKRYYPNKKEADDLPALNPFEIAGTSSS